MFVLGAGVKGGSTTAAGPASPTDVDADLMVTTDYRSVLSEIVASRFGAGPATVFPRFTPEASLGFMSAT